MSASVTHVEMEADVWMKWTDTTASVLTNTPVETVREVEYVLLYVYMLQSIVGTSHYREWLKCSVITGNGCDNQSLPGIA